VFVAREQQMAQLRSFLDQAVAGVSGIVLVTGSAGQGKTALLGEFARRALDAYPDLLVAKGDCSAYSGVGDPYQPFRDVMAMLTGDVETRRLARWVGPDGARRLWSGLPLTIPALLTRGPSLIGTVLAGDRLLSRTANAVPGQADWLRRIRALTERARTAPVLGDTPDLEQSFLFGQYTDVLCALADSHPLLIILDDLQWADPASVGLLFHLGRRLAGAEHRILVACAYRPEELVRTRDGKRHPLEQALHEFKAAFGDVWVDLDSTDSEGRRRFVDALLDTEPNRLGEPFRSSLYHRTAGHPLFTIELLRAMQERGDLVRVPEADDAWVEGAGLDWDALPARVEAVIEERVGRLEPHLKQVLTTACVEGEAFTAQVVATAQDCAEATVIQALGELETVHHLVREQSQVQTGARWMVHYQFSHVLVQAYLYQRLSGGERRFLHMQVAEALLHLYEGQSGKIAVQLAHHFTRAGDHGRAFRYSVVAAENASRAYAREAAIALYTQAIGLAESVEPGLESLEKLRHERGLAYEALGKFDEARLDFETNLKLGQTAGEHRVEWRALLDLAKLWTLRDYGKSRDLIDQALDLARRMDDPAVLASSLNWVGNWWLNAEDLTAAIKHHKEALAIVEQLGDRATAAHMLDDLGLATGIIGDSDASDGYYERAIRRFRELEDQAGLASSLTGRGIIHSGAFATLTTVPHGTPADAHRDLAEALRIARTINSASAEAWALWGLSFSYATEGEFGQALAAVRGALEIASAIGHREWVAASRSILGVLYVELLAPEAARPQLEQALSLAKILRSQHWIHATTAGLVAACWLGTGSAYVDDLAHAQACLEGVISPQAPMDTIHRRTCWARRAELALQQGDPAVALDIVDRLIASAPGIAPGRVIPFLWMLKGQALAAMGHPEEACAWLCAGVQSARASGARFLLWRLHASLGRVYRALGRPTEADVEISTAHDRIRELADTIPDQGLRDAFIERAYSRVASGP
jgi:tetratricopeptide (TPR) repeat protein